MLPVWRHADGVSSMGRGTAKLLVNQPGRGSWPIARNSPWVLPRFSLLFEDDAALVEVAVMTAH